MIDRGMDLLSPDVTTEAETAAFKAETVKVDGRSHVGFDFLLDNDPGPAALKRYRLMVRSAVDRSVIERMPGVEPLGFIGHYALLGYLRGINYMTVRMLNAGLSKPQVIQGLAIPFLVSGPRGIESIAEALAGMEWNETGRSAEWAPGWEPDPEAFRSGIDFGKPELAPGEIDSILDWYRSTLGEVPAYAAYLARHNPKLLKAYRIRFENLIVTLPKQLVPTSLLLFYVLHGDADGIRENVLLCRAWGVSLESTLASVALSSPNGISGLGLVEKAAGDVLERWS